jgi:hypothetical protein
MARKRVRSGASRSAAAPRQPRGRGGAPVRGPQRAAIRRERPGGRAFRRVIRLVRRRPLAIAAALALLHIAMGLLTFEPRPHTGGDNGAYITLGRSLLEHGTYTELWDPAEPPHTKYPPVFPAILAIAMAAGLTPWVPLKLVVLGLSATAVAFSFLWLRARRRAAFALGIGALLAVAPGVLREGRWLLSDVPFWAFTMIALWAFERLRPADWKRFAIAAAATLLAYFTRSAGLPLVVAALGWLAWRRHWRQCAALAVIVGLPAAVWWLRSRAFGPSGYVSEFWLVDPYLPLLGTIGIGDLFSRIGTNTIKYVSIHLPTLLTGGRSAPAVALSVLIAGLAMSAWTVRLRRPRVSELFLLLYLGLILIWPAVWSGERFLLPLLPLLLILAGDALLGVAGRVAPRHDLRAVAAMAGLVLLLAIPRLAAGVGTGVECTSRYLSGERYPCLGNPYHADFFHFSTLMGDALPHDAVVLNRKPRLFHVLSGGLKSVNYPLSDDPDEFFTVARDAGARHVLFDQLDGVAEIYLRPIIARKARAFCLMRVSDVTGTVLFGILPGGDTVPDLTREELLEGLVSFAFCDDEYWRSPLERRRYERS